MASGRCPKCQAIVDRAKFEPISIERHEPPPIIAWTGASYLCPHCNTVLSVGMDPFARDADLVDEILRRLRDQN